MNRQIKFRVWDNKNGGFLQRHLNEYAVTGKGRLIVSQTEWYSALENVNPEDFIIQQFTGLLDKNKKEICEGDIVKFTHKSHEHGDIEEVIAHVLWDSRYGAWGLGKEEIWYLFSDYGIYTERMEVIGNIFEH